MSLISSQIPNLVNGVSQQPSALRLASQAELQDNFMSSVATGLSRRPGTKHIAQLTTEDWSDAFLHVISRDAFERYLVAVTDGDLQVFDLVNGKPVAVNFPDGVDYLTGASGADFRAVTVADYTFIVNRSVKTAVANATTPARLPQALIHVAGGNYGKTFTVTINGVEVASYETPDGSDAAQSPQVSTDYITDQIMSGLTSAPSLAGGEWSIERFDNVISITNSTGSDFSITSSDGFDGSYMSVVTDKVQRFTDLPPHAPVGFRCEVTGEASSAFDNYYVEWVSDVGSEKSGVWQETVKWGIQYRYRPGTMPHVLVREADGTFTFREETWGERTAGDEDSAPLSSFAGRTISDVFFFKNRLGFAADENIIMSRAGGDYFNFWPKTVTALLDSDPIDVGVNHVKVSKINHAVPFNDSLLLFSDQTQFSLTGGDLLTPSTASITATTEYAGSANVRPVGAGSFIYFPVPRGHFSAVREYYADRETLSNSAADITAHCPKYVPGNVVSLSASTNEDILVALSANERNALYVYKYFQGGEGKLQSAWSRWVFGDDDVILDAAFIESQLYLVIGRPSMNDGVFLEVMDIEAGAVDEGSDVSYRADRLLYERDCPSVTYDGTYTEFTMPYSELAPLWVFVRAGDQEYPEGYVVNHERTTNSRRFRILGDWRDRNLAIGRKYKSRYIFSPFLIKESATGGGQSSITDGRLQIMHLGLDFERSGYFETHVTPEGRDPFIQRFTGRVVGSLSNRLNTAALEDGRFRFPVRARNTDVQIEICTEHFLPCAFMSASWEGRLTMRSRRV